MMRRYDMLEEKKSMVIRTVNARVLLLIGAAYFMVTQGIHQRVDAVVEKYQSSVIASDKGMSTIEYALGCVAAAALGAVLYTIVTSDTVTQAITRIFEDALSQGQ